MHQVEGKLVHADLGQLTSRSMCLSTGPSRQNRSTMSSGTKSTVGLSGLPWWL